MKKTFPIHGILGIFVLILSEILHFRKVDPFYSWFYCFAWWSYILTVDAVVYRLKGNSLMINRTRAFFLMIPWSIFIWLVFEAANFSLKNWYYINLPNSIVERWAGYAVAYGTVLPGLFETTELLETIGLFKGSRVRSVALGQGTHVLLVLLGLLCLGSSVLVPRYCFSLIWVGFIFLLEPFNDRFSGRSLLRDLENGTPQKICLLLLGGLICGLLWEFWNYWARSKWVYTVPFFTDRKGFEMPFLGFLGFPPFAIQAYVMYNFISLFRFGRGWEQSTYRLHPERKSKLSTSVLTVALIGAFSVLVFTGIDRRTVDSYEPLLSEAYWIPAEYRLLLSKAGIISLDDLLSKTRPRKEMEELALRLFVPREELLIWVGKARLVKLKGLGIQNFRLLDEVGIESVANLAAEDPENLYQALQKHPKNNSSPDKAKILIWIREAQKQVKSLE